MASKAASWLLGWDLPAAEAVRADQRWVLRVMKQHGPALVNMLWRILGNEDDVCDAYQAAFLRLAGSSTSGPRNPKAFVFRTAGNTAISMLRKRATRQKAFGEMTRTAAVSTGSHAEMDLDIAEMRDSLRKCLWRLPETCRNVVLLRDLAELPYGEVGRILGITPETARVYRCRAVRMLGKMMDPEAER